VRAEERRNALNQDGLWRIKDCENRACLCFVFICFSAKVGTLDHANPGRCDFPLRRHCHAVGPNRFTRRTCHRSFRRAGSGSGCSHSRKWRAAQFHRGPLRRLHLQESATWRVSNLGFGPPTRPCKLPCPSPSATAHNTVDIQLIVVTATERLTVGENAAAGLSTEAIFKSERYYHHRLGLGGALRRPRGSPDRPSSAGRTVRGPERRRYFCRRLQRRPTPTQRIDSGSPHQLKSFLAGI
jgi:hypothetical protein